MKKIFNYIVKILLPILLGVLILYMVYDDFDFSRLYSDLKNMDMFWFLLSTFFGIMSHVIRGWRWRLTLSPLGYNPSSSTCVNSIFLAYAANLVVPRVGEVSRCMVLKNYEDVPFAPSLGTLVTERLIDTLMVLLITVVAVALQWPVFSEFMSITRSGDGGYASWGNWGILLLVAVVILVLAVFLLKKTNLWKKIRVFIVKFVEGMLSLTKMKNWWLFVIETFGIWFCYFMQFYLCFFCFQFTEDLSVLAGLLLFVAGSIAVVVPTTNGAGPWHFVVTGIMVLYGVGEADSKAFALIVHGTQTLLVAVLGIYALMALNFKKKQHKNI